MPAAQFGNHPTLGQYIAWARGQGCDVNYGIHGTLAVIKITAPSGKEWVHISGLQQDEYLAPGMVGHMDRRLGLKSPFSSV